MCGSQRTSCERGCEHWLSPSLHGLWGQNLGFGGNTFTSLASNNRFRFLEGGIQIMHMSVLPTCMCATCIPGASGGLKVIRFS